MFQSTRRGQPRSLSLKDKQRRLMREVGGLEGGCVLEALGVLSRRWHDFMQIRFHALGHPSQDSLPSYSIDPLDGNREPSMPLSL